MKSLVKVRLAERSKTKREVAEAIGVSEMTLWRWTTDEGIEKLPLGKLKKLAEAIGCDIKDLFED